MRIGRVPAITMALAALVVVPSLASVACGGTSSLFRQYEYEEEMYLSLDGTATVYVNTSIAALNALRGTSFDANPSARFDREVFRTYFSSPNTHVTRVSQSRRAGRRFVHVRIDVDDVRRLSDAPPFAWSKYQFDRVDDQYVYVQRVASSPEPRAPSPESRAPLWKGDELVAFRMHLPSKIDFHNTTTHEVGRGNILSWEQPLAERLRGVPLTLEARMETQSILYRTIWLFAASFVAVAIAFVLAIWWILRRGKPAEHEFRQAS